jgi:hypothetical protein
MGRDVILWGIYGEGTSSMGWDVIYGEGRHLWGKDVIYGEGRRMG